MTRLGLLLLSAALTASADDLNPRDLDQLQGTWTVVTMEIKGKPIPPEKNQGRVTVIDGKTFTDRSTTKVFGKGTFTLDATRSPKTIDATFTEGFPKGRTTLAIYELEGDTLKACTTEPGAKERPSAFTTKEGPGHMLVTYKRSKP
jgi:uncharacterized protein (TIGR03067 family)